MADRFLTFTLKVDDATFRTFEDDGRFTVDAACIS